MKALRSSSRQWIIALIALIPYHHLNAQECDPSWRKVDGVEDMVFALMMWDPDGLGPREPVLVVGGKFTEAGGMPANHIATWNPATGEWGALGSGVNSWVRSLATLPSGDLVAGGHFNLAGGEAADRIARWDGERWHAMGRGLPDGFVHFEYPEPGVYTLNLTPVGELIAGGNFFVETGDPEARHVARWDGDVWQPLEQQLPLGCAVQALHFMGSGDLIAGGYFSDGIRRWDGVRWYSMGQGLKPGAFGLGGTYALATDRSGDLIAGGLYHADFGGGLDFHGIARWDGAAWGPLGEDPNGAVYAMLPQSDGSVIVTGGFDTAGGEPAPGLARYGEEWSALPGGRGGSALAELPSGEIAIGYGGGLAIWGCRECYADCDGSGDLAFLDFLCFQNLFTAGDVTADCDESGKLDFFDFLCFQNAFAAGCP